MTLTRADIADRLIAKVKFSSFLAKDFVDEFFETIAKTVENGEPVKLTGFGNFELRVKPPRPGRNPKTGEDALITARRVVTFHPGQKMKERISG